MTLTADQRWLLMTMGGWQVIDALIGPGGVNHMMQSCWGSYRHTAIPGAPEWMHSFETQGGKVYSPCAPEIGEPKVVLTGAQINRFAAQLPQAIRDELSECAKARTARTEKSRWWCHCGDPEACHRRHEGDPLYGGRHHPTEAEDGADMAMYHSIREWEDDLLMRALGLRERVGQLDLFEAV